MATISPVEDIESDMTKKVEAPNAGPWQPVGNQISSNLSHEALSKFDIDLNEWREKPFTDNIRSTVLDILNMFDYAGNGRLAGWEVEKTAKMVAAANDKKGNAISIKAFPDQVRESVAAFDLDNSGYVDSSELISGANALRTLKQENRYMKIAIGIFIVILVIFCIAIFGLTFAVIKMTEQTEPPSAGSPSMYVKGTTEPVRVDSVGSYATLTDLIDMPLEVIDTIEQLTFMTVTGQLHSYPKQGVKLSVLPSGDKELVFHTSMAGTTVRVLSDRAYYESFDLATGELTSVRVSIPEEQITSRRRRALRTRDGSDLDKRCHASGACLHTLEEIMHMHGHSEIDEETGRFLASASSTSSGASYAKVKKDAYSITSDAGFVSWDQESDTDAVLGGGASVNEEEEVVIVYDDWGCMVEEGFLTQAYPLTTKHCFVWRQVDNCEQLTISADGYVLSYPSSVSNFMDHEKDLPCDQTIGGNSPGFCECGGGFKIKAGACGDNANADFACADICLTHAKTNGNTVIDLYDASDERLMLPFDLDKTLTKDFFAVDETVNNDFVAGVKDSVYISTRLAYRRETPAGFGQAEWPEWFDYKTHVRARFNGDSLSESGTTWIDVGPRGLDASVSAGFLESKTYQHGGGENFEVKVIAGNETSVVDFDLEVFPPSVFVSYKSARLKACDVDPNLCADFSFGAASELEQHETFLDFLEAGSPPSRVSSDVFLHKCQSQVVGHEACGKFFDSVYPDFSTLAAEWTGALENFWAGIAAKLPATKGNFVEYELCAEADGSCACDGVIRYADATANANSVHHDGFTFIGVTGEESQPNGFSGTWKATSSAHSFNGEIAHYFDSDGAALSCNPATLIPTALGLEYSDTVARFGEAMGRDTSTWNCYCKGRSKILDLAKTELTNGTFVLDSDWSTHVPFSSSDLFFSTLTVQELSLSPDNVNPIHELASHMGAFTISASCRCKKTSFPDVLGASDVKFPPHDNIALPSTVYTIEDADPKRSAAREGQYWTFFHVARYSGTSGEDRKRIFQNSNSLDGEWFDGFDSGKSGVANHHSDFVTVQDNAHDTGWVLSTSTQFSYRSNFINRPLASSHRTQRSLQGVKLNINGESAKSSKFEIADMLVLSTPKPLTQDQLEDIEIVLYLKYIPLFIRAHYTVDGWIEDFDGSSSTWDDEGIFHRHATISAGSLEKEFKNQTGYVLKSSANTEVTFPDDVLPKTGPFSMIAVATPGSSSTPIFHVGNDDEYQTCLDSSTPADQWSIVDCKEKGPSVTITATETNRPLILCEVEVLTSSAATSSLSYGLRAFSNVAANRPTFASSSAPTLRHGYMSTTEFQTLKEQIGDGVESKSGIEEDRTLLVQEGLYQCSANSNCYSDSNMLEAVCDQPVSATVECEALDTANACVIDGEASRRILVASCASKLEFIAMTFRGAGGRHRVAAGETGAAAVIIDGGGNYIFTSCRFVNNLAVGPDRGAGAVYVGNDGSNTVQFNGNFFDDNKWLGTPSKGQEDVYVDGFTVSPTHAWDFSTGCSGSNQVVADTGTGSSLGLTATAVNGASCTSLGMTLDGVDDYVNLSPLENFGDTFTIEAYVKVNEMKSWSRLFDWGDGAGSNCILLALNEGATMKAVSYNCPAPNSASCLKQVNTPEPYEIGQWHHFVLTAEGNRHVLYVDGKPVSFVGSYPFNQYDEAASKAWAEENGYDTTCQDVDGGVKFGGNGYAHHGLYAYTHGSWIGCAFFGRGGSAASMDAATTARHDTIRPHFEVYGKPVITHTAVNPVPRKTRANHYLGKSNWPDAYAAATIKFFNVYDNVALQASDVAHLHSKMPMIPLPTHAWDFESDCPAAWPADEPDPGVDGQAWVEGGWGKMTFQGETWYLVRRQGKDAFHRSTDNARGTQEYNSYDPDPLSSSEFSVNYNDYEYDKILFAWGNLGAWATAPKSTMDGIDTQCCHGCTNFGLLDTSHVGAGARQYSRSGCGNAGEDPWISAGHHPNQMVYSETPPGWGTNHYWKAPWAPANSGSGLNVWVNSVDVSGTPAFPFDLTGTVSDTGSSAISREARLINGATCVAGKGASLDGSDQFVDLEDWEWGGVFSIETEVLFNSLGNPPSNRIFDFGNGQTLFPANHAVGSSLAFETVGVSMMYPNGKPSSFIGASGGFWSSWSTGNVQKTEEWAHLVVSFGKNSVTIIKNGLTYNEYSKGFADVNALAKLTRHNHFLGRSNYANQAFMNGYIKNFRVYNGIELTVDQASQLYANMAAAPTPTYEFDFRSCSGTGVENAAFANTGSGGSVTAQAYGGASCTSGEGLQLYGGDDFVDIPGMQSGGVESFEFVMQWQKWTAYSRAFDFGDGVNNANILFCCSTTNQVGFHAGYAGDGTQSGTWLPVGGIDSTEHHIVVVHSTNGLRIFIDGEQKYSDETTRVMPARKVRAQNWLGRSAWGASNPNLHGNYVFFRSYLDQALSEEEINLLYLNHEKTRTEWEVKTRDELSAFSAGESNVISFGNCTNHMYGAGTAGSALDTNAAGSPTSYEFCVCKHCDEEVVINDSDSAVAVDGNEDTCTMTRVTPGETMTWEVELGTGVKVDKVVVKSGEAFASSAFEVRVNNELVGKTERFFAEPDDNLEEIPSFVMDTDEFHFVVNDVSTTPSVWLTTATETSFLEICEVEVYGELSYYPAGGLENPNIALNRPTMTSSVSEGHSSAAVDGDPRTCVKTREGSLGMFRVDLDPGTLPTKVIVKGRVSTGAGITAAPYDCEKQMAGIDGVVVSMGTPAYHFTPSQFAESIRHHCGVTSHVVTSDHDVTELYLKIEGGIDLQVCGVEVYEQMIEKTVVNNETEFYLAGRHIYLEESSTGEKMTTDSVLATVDGNATCSGDGLNLLTGSLFVAIDRDTVVSRIVLHTKNNTNGMGERVYTTASLSNGVTLGTVSSASLTMQTLTASDAVTASQQAKIDLAAETAAGNRGAFCGVSASKYAAATPYIEILKQSSRCSCSIACEAHPSCKVWSFVQSGSMDNFMDCYLSQTSTLVSEASSALALISGGEGVIRGETVDTGAADLPDSVPAVTHAWDFRGCQETEKVFENDPGVEGQYFVEDGYGMMKWQGEYWYLVRRAQNKWHLATDDAMGTSSYNLGGDTTNPVSAGAQTWSKQYYDFSYDKILFMTGDKEHWVLAPRSLDFSQQCCQYCILPLIDTSLGLPGARQYMRAESCAAHGEKAPYRVDPWVSTGHHGDAGGGSKMVYAEDNSPWWTGADQGLHENLGGSNVWVNGIGKSWSDSGVSGTKINVNAGNKNLKCEPGNGLIFDGTTHAELDEWEFGGTLSFEVYARFDQLGGYRRLFDFGVGDNGVGYEGDNIRMGMWNGDQLFLCQTNAEMQYGCAISYDGHNAVDQGNPTDVATRRAYSSVWSNEAVHFSHGRGSLDGPQAWSAGTHNAGEWAQIDLGAHGGTVTGIVTQSRRGSAQRVFTGTVKVSSDGVTWTDVDGGKVFTTCSVSAGTDEKFYNTFDAPLKTRFVRLYVGTYQNHISLRWAVTLDETLGVTKFEVGDFVHAVATISSTEMKLYMNGQLVNTQNMDQYGEIAVYTRTSNFLGKSLQSDPLFKGAMRYMRMWEGSELTADNVMKLYETRDFGRSLKLSSVEKFEIAEILILDNHLPSKISQILDYHIQSQYVYLLNDGEDLADPVIQIHAGFVVEGGGVPFAVGPGLDWYQAPGDLVSVNAEIRETFGLSDTAHSISGIDSYLISDYLQPNCIRQPSEKSTVEKWGFDPVSTSAYNGGLRRSKDSYGVEIESMTLCRRMQSTTSALRNLAPSTVCGLLSVNSENPTCQPTKFVAEWAGDGIRFSWLPGCRAATKYQVVRERTVQIGKDFDKETTQGTTVPNMKESFCNEGWIRPGSDLVDSDQDLLNDIGAEVEYCIRSMIPLEEGGIVVSDWMCTKVVIGWTASLQTSVRLQKGGNKEEGVLVDAVLCKGATIPGCFDLSEVNLESWTHSLEDGGAILAFSAFSTSSKMVKYEEEDTGSCKYIKGNHVENDKPDFVAIVDGEMGLAWYSETPGCFLLVEGYKEVEGGAGASFHVKMTGGVQRLSGFLGFAHHIQIKRAPSWHYMGKNCRETCSMTGRVTSVQGETFSLPFVNNIKSSAYCEAWKYRCPGGLSAIAANAEGRGAIIFGHDMNDGEEAKVVCSPYENEFAYFDKEENAYKCCEDFKPTAWDNCGRHYTECTNDFPVALGSVGEVPKREFFANIDSAQPIAGIEGPNSAWLQFFVGEDNDEADAPSTVHLVDTFAARSNLGGFGYGEVNVGNAITGAIDKFYTGRTNKDGNVVFRGLADFENGNGDFRNIELFPFAASEFLLPDNFNFNPLLGDEVTGTVNTTVHKFMNTDGKEKITAVVPHRIDSVVAITDKTAVDVFIKVTHPQVGTGLSCGADGHYMCAFSVDGAATEYDCGTTDELGNVMLSVPPGVEVDVRNGCPREAQDRVDDCAFVEGIKVGRNVEKYEQDVYEATPDVKRVSPAQALSGLPQYFVEVNSKFVDIRLAAGRYDTGFENAFGEPDPWQQGWMLSNGLLGNMGVTITDVNDRAGCDGTTDLFNLMSKDSNRLWLLPVPRDLDLAIGVHVDKDADMESADMVTARTYLNSLEDKVVSGEVDCEIVVKDTICPSIEFMYRTTPTLHFIAVKNQETGPIDSCTNSDSNLQIFGLAGYDDAKRPQEVDFTIAVKEVYTFNDGKGAVGVDDAVLTYVPGTLTTEDNMAASTQSRFSSTGGNLGILQPDEGSDFEQCAGSTGCEVAGPSTMLTTRECLADSPCEVGGEDMVGTLYQARITVLGNPERYEPHTKVFRYSFLQAIGDKGVPGIEQQEMTAVEQVEKLFVVEGLIPLTANQAIKLPEYVPFVIIRKPPGGGSAATWERGTTLELSIGLAMEDSQGEWAEIEAHAGATASWEATIGTSVGVGGEVIMEFTEEIAAMEVGIGASGVMSSGVSKVYQRGSTLGFEAGTSYSTSGEQTGTYADLLVTPSLAIRTITNMPIIFVNADNDSTCGGLAQSETSTWQLLSGDSNAVKEKLEEYDVDSGAVTYTTDKHKLRNYAKEAIADKTWNALTVHTVFDILHQRIPQLSARCAEEWKSLKCHHTTADSYFDTLKSHFATSNINEWCDGVLDTYDSTACLSVPSVTVSDEEEALAKLRMEACIDGIKGWIGAVRLNEDLKKAAIKVESGELVQSGLAPKPQHFGSQYDAWMETRSSEMYSQMSFLGQDLVDGNNGLNKATYKSNLPTGDTNHPGLLNTKKDYDSRREVPNEASIIAFSGGGEVSYSTSMSTSQSLVLAFAQDSSVEGFVGASFDYSAGPFAAGGSGGAGGFKNGKIPTFGKESERAESETTTISFTLADPDEGDYFDVEVSRDPIYGTPVFKTLAGRSACPHEFGTDARDAFDVVFPATENKLDMTGSDANSKARSIARQVGADVGTCAAAFVEVVNETPYDDDLELWMELTPPKSNNGGDPNDFTGIHFTTDGLDMPYLAMLYDDERRRYRAEFCPSGEDDRTFIARGEKFTANNVLDANGAAMSGYLFCNLGIDVYSKCEHPVEWGWTKGGVFDASKHTICSADPVASRTFESSVTCFEYAAENIFTGSDASTGNYRFVEEKPLKRQVLIPCLSFDPSTNLCDANPCDGM